MKILHLNSVVAALLVSVLAVVGLTSCSSGNDAKAAGETLQGYHDAVLDLASPTLRNITSRSALKRDKPKIAAFVDLEASTDAGVAYSMKYFSIMKGLAEGASLRYEINPEEIKVQGNSASVPDRAAQLFIAGRKDHPSTTPDEVKYRMNKVDGRWLLVLDKD